MLLTFIKKTKEETTDPLVENSYKDLQPGASIEAKEAFVLLYKESSVSAEVISMEECLGGKSSGKATKEFVIK